MNYYTADLHFSHQNIIKYCNRPFKDIIEMNEHLLFIINLTVHRKDTLFILGDFAWGKSEENIAKFRNRMNCENIHIILGNHDNAPYWVYTTYFNTVSLDTETNIQGIKTILHHYPKAFWNKSHRGSYHLYGHSHSEAEKQLDEKFPGRRSLDVGVDNAYEILGKYRPFSEKEIIQYMSDRPGHGEQR